MGRPAIVDTEALLRVARELFLSQGFGVTTAVIARKAGISEGSIYKRFPTKEDLFFAAMGFPEARWADALPARVGQGRIAEQLAEILLAVIEFFRELVPRTMTMWSCRTLAEQSTFFQRPESPARRSLAALTGYLQAEIDQGRLRPVPAETLARVLLGAAQNFAFYEMMGINVSPESPEIPESPQRSLSAAGDAPAPATVSAAAASDDSNPQALATGKSAQRFSEEFIDMLMHGLRTGDGPSFVAAASAERAQRAEPAPAPAATRMP